jgi:hypothetical protein
MQTHKAVQRGGFSVSGVKISLLFSPHLGELEALRVAMQ